MTNEVQQISVEAVSIVLIGWFVAIIALSGWWCGLARMRRQHERQVKESPGWPAP